MASQILIESPNTISSNDFNMVNYCYQLMMLADNADYLQMFLREISRQQYQSLISAHQQSPNMRSLLALFQLENNAAPLNDKISILIDAGMETYRKMYPKQQQTLIHAAEQIYAKLPAEIRDIRNSALAALREGLSPLALDYEASLREALHLFRLTVKHPSGMRDHVAWFNIGWLLWKLDDRLEDAEKALTIAVRQSMEEKDQYFLLAARQLAYTSFLLGKYTEASQTIQLALHYAFNDPSCLLLQLYMAAKMNDNATMSTATANLLSAHPYWLSHLLAIPEIASCHLQLQPVIAQLMNEALDKTANALTDFSELLYDAGETASSVFRDSLLSEEAEVQIQQFKALRSQVNLENDDWLSLHQVYFEANRMIDIISRDMSETEVKIPLLRTFEWIHIPAGEFLFGEENQAVLLPDYYIMKYPVTVSQYRQFCIITDRPMPHPPEWGWQDSHPMVNINWHDAMAFVEWCGLALPTEEEWEKAARGTAGNRFPWGEEWDASNCSNGVGGAPAQTSPVTAHANGASPFGVVDMVGNVWEWCENWHIENKTRAMRGGSWMNSFTGSFLATSRDHDYPTDWYCYHGFRCVSRS